MYAMRRRGPVVYEDLLLELEAIEQQLLIENSSLAMNLMVLEAKIRERFQRMETTAASANLDPDFFASEDMTLEEIRDLIPRDVPAFSGIDPIIKSAPKKFTWKTIGTAAVLAVFTAISVFGLASILQYVLSWLA